MVGTLRLTLHRICVRERGPDRRVARGILTRRWGLRGITEELLPPRPRIGKSADECQPDDARPVVKVGGEGGFPCLLLLTGLRERCECLDARLGLTQCRAERPV